MNAQHIKQVPGRKTDVKDCAWIAQLLQHGLLKASLVPPRPQQELRELTRQRSQLVGEQSRVAQRIHKVLEDANIKLASVASEVMGVSGRAMLRSLIAGEIDPAKLADLAQRKLRGKMPALTQALAGRVTEHHRFLLKLHLEHYEQLERLIEQLSVRVGEQLAPFTEAREVLETIPGIATRAAEVILAEVGTDVKPFRTSAHLASWAGLCPGTNESAGKRRTGKMRKGSVWLRAVLIQAASPRTSVGRRRRKRAAAALAQTWVRTTWTGLEPERLTKRLASMCIHRKCQSGC